MPNYISIWENVNTKKRVHILSTRYMKTCDGDVAVYCVSDGLDWEKNLFYQHHIYVGQEKENNHVVEK